MYNSHIWTERTCIETVFVVSSVSYERSIWPSLSVEPRETNSGDKHCELSRPLVLSALFSPRGGGLLPYMGYIGMYQCEWYSFQAVYSWIGYINQRAEV